MGYQRRVHGDTDSVATAPKAPPKRKLKTKKPIHPYPPQPPKRKKPFKLKIPKFKIPSTHKISPLNKKEFKSKNSFRSVKKKQYSTSTTFKNSTKKTPKYFRNSERYFLWT